MRTSSRFSNFVKNSNGSATALALVGIALLAITGLAAVEINNFLGRDQREVRAANRIDFLSQSLTTLLSNPDVCLNGVDGLGTRFNGLEFENARGGVSAFDPSSALGNGQNVRFSTNFNGGLLLRSDSAIDGATLNRFYLKARPAGGPRLYEAELMAGFTPVPDSVAISDKLLANIVFELTPGGYVERCGVNVDGIGGQALCQNMGCTYNPDSPDQRCQCPLPEMSCATGEYIAGIDMETHQPICENISLVCETNKYLVGVDGEGNKLCADIIDAAPTPAPTPIPTPTPSPTPSPTASPSPTATPIGPYAGVCLAQTTCSGPAINRITIGTISVVGTVLDEPSMADRQTCWDRGGTCLQAEVVLDRFGGYTGIYRLFCHTGTNTSPYIIVNGSGTFACRLQ